MKLEGLVVGQFNEIAVKASEMVIENPGRDYPVLILQGDFGSGKSHLIKVIEQKVSKNHTVLSKSGNSIMNEMIDALTNRNFPKFRQSIEEVDILIIDGFQDLKNRTGTQDLLLNAIKHRLAHKKQTIITSCFAVNEIEGITEELESLLQSSLIVEIHRPDFEERIAVTKQIAKSRELSLYDDVAIFVSETFVKSLREIEGAVIKLEAISKILKVDITLDLAREHLRVPTKISETKREGNVDLDDEKYNEAVQAVTSHRVASASFLQRRLGVGYNRAAGLIGEMERNGIIGPAEGSKPRKVLVPAPKEP